VKNRLEGLLQEHSAISEFNAVSGFQSQADEIMKECEYDTSVTKSMRLDRRKEAKMLYPDLYICKSDIPQKIMELDIERLKKSILMSHLQKEEFKELSTRYNILFPPQRPSKNFSDYTEAEKEFWGRPMASTEEEAVHMMTIIKSYQELSKFYEFLMKFEKVRSALGSNMTIFIPPNEALNNITESGIPMDDKGMISQLRYNMMDDLLQKSVIGLDDTSLMKNGEPMTIYNESDSTSIDIVNNSFVTTSLGWKGCDKNDENPWYVQDVIRIHFFL
jgi:hypothetical protein